MQVLRLVGGRIDARMAVLLTLSGFRLCSSNFAVSSSLICKAARRRVRTTEGVARLVKNLVLRERRQRWRQRTTVQEGKRRALGRHALRLKPEAPRSRPTGYTSLAACKIGQGEGGEEKSTQVSTQGIYNSPLAPANRRPRPGPCALRQYAVKCVASCSSLATEKETRCE